MAITFKTTNKALTHLYTYDASAATYSANRAGVATHDLFADDAAIGDIIYFGATDKFSDLYFNIGTVLAADAITLVWEYWNPYAGAWQTLTVTDNTNSFQNAGANTVLFTPPVGWGMGYSANDPKPNNINNRVWVRCRITAVTNLTEGGANQTTAIYAKTAKIVVTGTYTDLMPSLYAADVAGGWGVVLRQVMFDNHGYNYCLVVPVDIGDGSTATTVTLKNDVVELMDLVAIVDTVNSVFAVNHVVFIVHSCQALVVNYLSVSYGTITNVAWMLHNNDFPGYGGASILSNNSLKNSISLIGRSQRWSGLGLGIKAVSGTNKQIIANVGAGGRGTYFGGTIDNVFINTALGFAPGGGRVVAHNVISESADRLLAYMDGASYTHIIFDNLQAPNSNVATPGNYLTYSAESNDIYIVYYFALTVIDNAGNPISGASVSIVNEQNTQNYGFNYTTGADNSGPLTTDVNGMVGPIMLVRYKHYNSTRTGYWKECDTTVNYGKSTVTISKTGYQTKTIKYMMDRKREEIEALEDAVSFVTGGGSPVLWNLDKTNSQNKHEWAKT